MKTIILGILLAGTIGTSFLLSQQPSQTPSRIHVHLQQAEAALRANDMETAVREFRAVLSLDPRNVEAHTNLGLISFLHGDCYSASEDFSKALAAQPSLSKAEALLGICQKRLGDPSAQKLLERSFSNVTDPKLRTQVGLELAELYQGSGDLEHSASVIGALVGLNPESPDILYYAQRAYSELADDTMNKLAVVAPGSARMQQVIAERLVNGGDLKGAIEHYRKVLLIDPKLPGVHFELAEAILESAPTDSSAQAAAQSELHSALQAEGDSARIECEFGRIAALHSDLDSALAHYSQAFQLNPHDEEAQLGLGRTLMSMSKPQEARKYLELAVQSDPLNTEAHYRLALAYRGLQMPEAAQKEMHLFQDIKKTKDRVKELYRQMNVQPKPERESAADLPQ